ncbi:DUF1330 domain-containing protein [Jiella endophytica]|uniref:DUF1330 domain-containing protein n=1 Tax=Jiella endophytica TaxID=2558362 RepID=A0A4Y8RGN4_9HYPH|nr:DUF1330 domain-containing protein [Jiella endophytica]TFF21641.1 DUF1330 domain-containing protein [Jiella endophytica]
MAKGYWIARVDVRDPEGYKDYIETAKPAFEAHGAKFIVRGGAVTTLEGTSRGRNVIIEFDSVETARACYESPDYQKAKAIRQKVSEGDIIIVEGP